MLEFFVSVSPNTWKYCWKILYIIILLDIINLLVNSALRYNAGMVVIASFLDLVFFLDIGLGLVYSILLEGFVSVHYFAQGSVLVQSPGNMNMFL